MDKMISMCPIQKICGVNAYKDKVEINKCVSYYNKFEKINIRLKNPTDKELQLKIDDCNIKCNKITDIFIIKKDDLTKFIIDNFRYVEPKIHYEDKQVEIPPYILGAWLGDGNSSGPALTNIDKPIIEAWITYGLLLGLQIRKDKYKDRITKIEPNEMDQVITYHITSGKLQSNIFTKKLRKLNLINNKHIPDIYLNNSVEVRCELLAGLLDTDGSLSKGHYEITQKNESLSNNIVTLCKSLGFYTKIKEKWNSCTNSLNPNHIDKYYRITISINQFSPKIPVLCDRKKFDYKNNEYWFNAKIDLKGNIILANVGNTEWTDNLKLILYSVVEKFKEKEPNQIIPWTRVCDFNDSLKDLKSEGLRAMYDKNLKLNYHLYKDRILQLEFNIIEKEWIDEYEKVKQNFINVKALDNHNWYQKQKKYENLYNSKKELLLELEKIKPKSNRFNLKEDLEYIKSEIITNKNFEKVILLKNGKLIIPSGTQYNCIGNTISQLCFELTKDIVSWNEMSRDKIIESFTDILDDYHIGLANCRTYMIIQFDLENKIIKEFNSCLDAAKHLVENNLIKSIGNGKIQISSACKSGKKQYNYKWIKWIDYYKE